MYAIVRVVRKERAMADHQQQWQIFIRNRQAVIEALRQGHCDGILPAARGFLDGFAKFLLDAGVLTAFEQFPDGRGRRTIPMFFFCNTLVHRPLFHLRRLTPIERTLFRSAYILIRSCSTAVLSLLSGSAAVCQRVQGRGPISPLDCSLHRPRFAVGSSPGPGFSIP